MNVLFVKGTPWASGYYRMEQAYMELKAMGYGPDIVFFNTLDPVNLVSKTEDAGLGETIINLTDYDIIIFQMVWHQALNTIIDKLNKLGKITAMEVDDDYDALPASNPSFWSFHPRGKLVQDEEGNRFIDMQQQHYKLTHTSKGRTYVRDKSKEPVINPSLSNLRSAMRMVKILQVSTPELKNAYSKYNDNIIVLENSIDNSLYYQGTRTMDDIPVIGWFGTKTHKEDLRIIDGCIPENCKLLIAGFPDIIAEGFFKYHKNIEVLPPYQLNELPSIVARCDIGVVPLVECRFNDGKSDLKGVEFGAGSVPVIASPVAPYQRWIRHGENGYLVKGNKAKLWIRYMQELVDNTALCLNMGKEAKKDAEARDIKKYITHWINAYYN